jgi:hypothetical protein
MDLTKRFPRSPRERLHGVAMLPRTIDKARAHLAGTLGEYIYDCPMDKQLFATLGVDAAQLAAIVERSGDDRAILEGLQRIWAEPKPPAIDEHNAAIENWRPKSDQGRKHFAETLARVAPGRTNVETWTDLIDIEEGRPTLA